MKKLVAILLSMLLILSLISCNKGEVKSGEEAKTETVEVTWWISRGEDSTYYMSYDDNPAVKYLETLDFNGKKVDLKFLVPVTGAERDNFNTLLMTEEYAKIFDMSYCTSTATEL